MRGGAPCDTNTQTTYHFFRDDEQETAWFPGIAASLYLALLLIGTGIWLRELPWICVIFIVLGVVSVPLTFVVLVLLFSEPDDLTFGRTSITSGDEARNDIARWNDEGEIPVGASDFYYWDEGWLSDHTTYWSFTCASVEDCKRAASPEHSSDDFAAWQLPQYSFIVKGPAYFGNKYHTDKWDLKQIQKGTSALYIRYNERASEMQYTAIDYDTLRVYRLRWFGDSLTTKLDNMGYKKP